MKMRRLPNLVVLREGELRLAEVPNLEDVRKIHLPLENHLVLSRRQRVPTVSKWKEYEPLDLNLVASAYLGEWQQGDDRISSYPASVNRVDEEAVDQVLRNLRGAVHSADELARNTGTPFFGIMTTVHQEPSHYRLRVTANLYGPR